MAKENHTYLLVVEYDEAQEDLFATFGTNAEEMKNVLNVFIDKVNKPGEAGDESFTQTLMSMIDSGKISGGMLLTMATLNIMNAISQKRAQSMLGTLLKDMLGNPELRESLGLDGEGEEPHD